MSNTDIIVTADFEVIDDETLKEKYEQVESDLDNIQQNLSGTADKINNQIDTLIEFTQALPHHNTYTALAKVVVAFAALNKEAAAIVKQRQDLYEKRYGKRQDAVNTDDENKSVTYNDNRSVFMGTATDLLDQVLRKKQEE